MSSNSTTTTCAPNDTLCTIKAHELEIIIVPSILLGLTLITLVAVCFLRFCPSRKRSRTTAPRHYKSPQHSHAHRDTHRHTNRHTHRHSHRHNLTGIDAPPGINPLEHEQLPMSVQQVQHNAKTTLAAVPQTSTQRQASSFSHVTILPQTLPSNPNDPVSVYRAQRNNRHVILRVLKESSNRSEKQQFLGFASFLSQLGPHPFIPALLDVNSVQPPLRIELEELQHRDLLGFLWRCRTDNSGLDSSHGMTEKRIFNMAGQVASALEYLHSQSCIHGNIGARSVLVGADLTAKLWGLSAAYRRKTQNGSTGEVDDMELKKWQAPEVLARRSVSQSSDIWSFGVLLYEMVTLGDPPFAQVLSTELLQYLQRGKHLKRPAACSSSLYSIIKSCCQWNSQQRLSMSNLIRTLQAGEQSANERTLITVAEPINTERYLREAGYGDAYNYAVF
ncbi:tyrosine-protein kinase STYK1 [Anabas testudineus]|uniref:Protein kinase domain-containing protein n=1 Tax=Anabas testudineus TaxID=64144 RepID=A0A3Q1K174_ANATE|nr:tyrosine-protein kinase STYK1 [Anabas testudineus]XP_026203796.1 tyrosine-protein kinase STYK1 [Anabas testudineus]